MDSVIVVGSVGIDTIETPYGRAAGVLGGSAVYAALAAMSISRRAARVAVVSVVGHDFPTYHRNFLSRGTRSGSARRQHYGYPIDLTGLVTINAPTFRWHGRYEFDMASARTLKTSLGALKDADQLVQGYKKLIRDNSRKHSRYDSRFLMLANIDPQVQLDIVQLNRQTRSNRFTLLDTMNYWIEHKQEKLKEAIGHLDCLVLNEDEARQLMNTPNLVKAGHQALELGPEYIIVKKGEHGSMLFSEHGFFTVPGYPLLTPIDPTGAGDSFAGALIGYLAREGKVTFAQMRKATVYATAVSSFTVEGMGPSRLANLKPKEVEERVEVFQQMRKF